jgi:hypothetical protein
MEAFRFNPVRSAIGRRTQSIAMARMAVNAIAELATK